MTLAVPAQSARGVAAALRDTARAFVAEQPVAPSPAVPDVAVNMLRHAIPDLSRDLAGLALAGFCTAERQGARQPLALDLFRSLWRLTGALALMAARSRRAITPREPVDVLLYCGSPEYYELRFKGIDAALAGMTVGRAGVDRPLMTLEFRRIDAWRAVVASLWAVPVLLVASVVSGTNLLKGFTRSIVTHGRARRYFSEHPASAYLTYEENTCTATVYSAFHQSGGRLFAAFQHGIWYNDEGLHHLCVDHLFPIGRAWGDRHARLGSRIAAVTPIGALAVGTHPARAALGKPGYDVVFIDQGAPVASSAHWGTAGPEGPDRYLDFVKAFAADRADLRLAYQERPYDVDQLDMRAALRRRLEGAPIELIEGSGFMRSYASIAQARVVVTMNSTLGLEALAMGRPAVFCNLTDRREYDVVPGPLQVSGTDYQVFRARIEAALAGTIGAGDLDVDYFVSDDTFRGPALIAAALRCALHG